MPAVNFEHKKYYTIMDGKICLQHKTKNANTVSRINKQGREVHEQYFSALAGKITDIYTRDSDYGKTWNVEIDGSEILQFQYSGGYANGFLKALPNVDFEQEVIIIPDSKTEGDKKKTTIFLQQNKKSLKWFYTKDDPNGLPPLRKIKVKGKDTWDDSDAMEFLENMVKEKIKPLLKGSAGAAVNEDAEGDINNEDAPF